MAENYSLKEKEIIGILFDDKKAYFGVLDINDNKASLIIGIDKEDVDNRIAEETVKERENRIIYFVIIIVVILVILNIVLYYFYKKKD